MAEGDPLAVVAAVVGPDGTKDSNKAPLRAELLLSPDMDLSMADSAAGVLGDCDPCGDEYEVSLGLLRA